MWAVHSCAKWSKSLSSTILASLKFNIPLCLVPSISPGPRSSRSFSAILNPSFVLHIVCKRSRASLFIFEAVNKMQKLLCSLLPTLPLNWCNCDKPNFSALSITITVALGTFTPTSITVVDTIICVSFFAKRCMFVSLTSDFCRPCTILIQYFGSGKYAFTFS